MTRARMSIESPAQLASRKLRLMSETLGQLGPAGSWGKPSGRPRSSLHVSTRSGRIDPELESCVQAKNKQGQRADPPLSIGSAAR